MDYHERRAANRAKMIAEMLRILRAANYEVEWNHLGDKPVCLAKGPLGTVRGSGDDDYEALVEVYENAELA